MLDTWFSSALWPFSTLGWPDKTPEMDAFYPNSLLITGHDILFFWVARMILMGEVITGELPFPQVFLHGLIYGKSYWRESESGIQYLSREERKKYDLGEKPPKDVHSKWEKMSKSKGNVIDPIEVAGEYGTDAMRYALCASTTGLPQIDLDMRRFEEFKNFINKVYNGSRFVFMHLSESIDLTNDLLLEDRWILSRLSQAISDAGSHLDTFAFDKLALRLYDFFWNEFCAYYLEICKPAMTDDKRAILATALSHALALLHPIAPFVTEELFSEIDIKNFGNHPWIKATQGILSAEVLAVAPFPKAIAEPDSEAEKTFEEMRAIVYACRNIRAEMQLPPSMPTDIHFSGDISHFEPLIRALIKCNEIHHSSTAEGSKAKVGDLTICIPLPEEMQEKEKARIKKERAKLQVQIESLEKKLANKGFIDRAPAELVEQTKQMLNDAKARLKILSQ